MFHPTSPRRIAIPLSFPFVCSGFSSLLQKGEMEGKIMRISICKNPPKLTHLFLLLMIACYCVGKMNMSFELSFL